MHFLVLFFVSLSIIIHLVNHFHSTFLKLFLKLFLFYSWHHFFSFFSWVSDNLTFNLLYSTIYINYRTFTVPFANSSIVCFDFSRIVYSLIFELFSLPTTPWNTICWISLGLASKAFCLLKSIAINFNCL